MSLRYYFPKRQVGTTPFTPTSVGSKNLWISPESIVPNAGGTGLSRWNDQSGLGNDLTNASAVNNPDFGTLNGFNIASFDGVNDSYTLPLSITSVFANRTSSAFIVVNPVATGADQRIISIREGGSTRWGIAINPSNQINGFTVTTGVPIVISRVDNAGNGNLWINGSLQDTFTVNAFTPSEGYVGSYGENGGFVLASDIAEIILFNRAVTTTERQNIEAYLTSKYDIS